MRDSASLLRQEQGFWGAFSQHLYLIIWGASGKLCGHCKAAYRDATDEVSRRRLLLLLKSNYQEAMRKPCIL
jgi:hypothetical protein